MRRKILTRSAVALLVAAAIVFCAFEWNAIEYEWDRNQELKHELADLERLLEDLPEEDRSRALRRWFPGVMPPSLDDLRIHPQAEPLVPAEDLRVC